MLLLTHVFRILSLLVAVLLFSECIAAQSPNAHPETWTGYLVNIVCAQDRVQKEKDFGANHTKRCLQMPSCDRNGFGFLTDKNEILRFDDGGNHKARALIMKTNRQADFRAKVRGARSNDVLTVTKIELLEPARSAK